MSNHVTPPLKMLKWFLLSLRVEASTVLLTTPFPTVYLSPSPWFIPPAISKFKIKTSACPINQQTHLYLRTFALAFAFDWNVLYPQLSQIIS